jgi:hypothetical protein
VYTIAYVDESESWISSFYQTLKNDFKVIPILVDNKSTIDGIIYKVFDEKVDGVVTDYLLEEEGDVSFNGNNLVDSLKGRNPYFPVLMLTSYEPQAISHTEDVNIIYGKGLFDGESEEELAIFITKVKTNIERYYQRIEETKRDIDQLVSKKTSEGLNLLEEEKLSKLLIMADELEPENKEIPSHFNTPESISQLTSFTMMTKQILDELKKRNNGAV